MSGLAWRVPALAVTHVAIFAAVGRALAPVAPGLENWLPADPFAPSTLAPELIFAVAISAVLVGPILRSRWSGLRLVLTVYWVLAGIMVLLPWIELVVFNLREVSPEGIGATFVVQGLAWAFFAPAAVWMLGRMRREASEPEANDRLRFGIRGWIGRLSTISIAYLFIYFLFGALVAWRAPVIREFYADVRMPGLGTIAITQLVRGLLWAAVALPVVRMMRGRRSETVLTIGLLFGVIMSAGLLLPNPLLPFDVRMVHLVEVTSSNFLFGLLVGWVLTPPATLAEREADESTQLSLRPT